MVKVEVVRMAIENCEKKLHEAERRISDLLEVIRPLVTIADEFDADGLDEIRLHWINNGTKKYNPEEELYSGRGGKCLLTLGQVLNARDVATLKKYPRPGMSDEMLAVRKLYEASLPNLPWDGMSEERRQAIVANYRKIGLP